jgi:hypothetical protein
MRAPALSLLYSKVAAEADSRKNPGAIEKNSMLLSMRRRRLMELKGKSSRRRCAESKRRQVPPGWADDSPAV